MSTEQTAEEKQTAEKEIWRMIALVAIAVVFILAILLQKTLDAWGVCLGR